MRNILLLAGVTIPAIYFANLFGVGAVTPGFDHGSTLPSDLGREDAGGAPQIFNLSLIAVGVCGVLAAIGLFLALRAFGVSMISYGVFPLPDPRHHSLDLLLILSMLTP
ncbi:MAG: hypothetical protein ACREH4_04365, partial [Vitreimonas sp.]